MHGKDWHEDFWRRTHRRLRAWGVNTIGNWSEVALMKRSQTAFTATLQTRGPKITGIDCPGGAIVDPFTPEFAASVEHELNWMTQEQVVGNPWCIGFFVDNEMAWGGGDTSLARAVLAMPAETAAKRAFREWLERKHGDIAALNAAWGTAHASFNALMASVTPPDTARAKEDLLALHELFAEKYFSHIAARIKARAPNKLYLGCRFAYWGGPAAWRAAARHCDVVSFNTYREKPFEDLPNGSVDRPILIGEFHFGAYDWGMFWPGCVATRDQRERADAYRRFQEAALRHPRYVGAHWFQWQDQALTARGGGENGQVGFVNIADQPYPELIDAARDIGRRMYPLRWRK